MGGMYVPTIQDVAWMAKVSIATVSRVINNSQHKVNQATRERVLEAIRALDYRPNALAQGLILKKTMTIGIIIPDISNPYYAEIVRGIQDVADQTGYAVMLQNTDRKQDRIVKFIRLFREKLADGIIFSGGIIHGYETLSALKELRKRVVVIGRHDVDFPAVRIDNVGGATQAVQHVIDLGHKRIGLIDGPEGSTTGVDRLMGYKNALAQSGYPIEESLMKQGDLTIRSGYLAARELLQGSDKPTAIFAVNDLMAFGAINAAKELGLHVPDDLSVVGCDNIPLSSYFEPPLTTVEIPMYDVGTAAMRMLIDLISGKPFERVTWFKTTLLVRHSTARIASCFNS